MGRLGGVVFRVRWPPNRIPVICEGGKRRAVIAGLSYGGLELRSSAGSGRLGKRGFGVSRSRISQMLARLKKPIAAALGL